VPVLPQGERKEELRCAQERGSQRALGDSQRVERAEESPPGESAQQGAVHRAKRLPHSRMMEGAPYGKGRRECPLEANLRVGNSKIFPRDRLDKHHAMDACGIEQM